MKSKNKCKHEHKKGKSKKSQDKPLTNYKWHYIKNEKVRDDTMMTKFDTSAKYYGFKTCKHPAMAIVSNLKGEDGEPLKGILTGGADTRQLENADLFVCLDYLRIPDVLIDSYGELRMSRQRVIYFPIVDMSIPDSKELDRVLYVMHEYLMNGKKVHVHCQGGHGRTGLVLACYIGKYTENTSPIAYIRKNYCEDAVESAMQHNFIKNYTGYDEPDEHPTKYYGIRDKSYWDNILGNVKDEDDHYTGEVVIPMTGGNVTGSQVPLFDRLNERWSYAEGLYKKDEAEELFSYRTEGDLFCPNCNDRVHEDMYDQYYCYTCKRLYSFPELI